MADDDFKKYEGQAPHRGADHAAPYPVSRLAPAVELVDLAKQIGDADRMVGTRVSAKLQVIADQIKALQAEARTVLEEARNDQELHRADCNFQRKPGSTYHLYRRDDGSQYFSMLSPQDWRGSPPHRFVGTYRLENDMSWTPADKLDAPDDSHDVVRRLLGDSGLS